MIQCSVCGTLLAHAWDGTYDKETGAFICNGCYSPELHADLDDSEWNPVVRCPWCGALAFEDDIEKPNCYCNHRPIPPHEEDGHA